MTESGLIGQLGIIVHPAWSAFVGVMSYYSYGREESGVAWSWFASGWEAAVAAEEARFAAAAGVMPDPSGIEGAFPPGFGR